MSHLYQALAERVDAWRAENYTRTDYPAERIGLARIEAQCPHFAS